jgi:hypothetical protein
MGRVSSFVIFFACRHDADHAVAADPKISSVPLSPAMKLLTMQHPHHHPKLLLQSQSRSRRKKTAPAQRFVQLRWATLGCCLVLTTVLVVLYADLLRKTARQHWSMTTMSMDLLVSIPLPNRPPPHGDEAAAAEMHAALSYVQSFRKLGKEGNLAFFHIPKTAGTAVEQAAGRQKINWGSCAFPHRPKRAICHYSTSSENQRKKKWKDHGNQTIITTKDWPAHIGWWHLPPFMFPIGQPTIEQTSRVWVDPYQNAELFGIVRHPYERMLSEYHYICTLKITSWRPDQCDRSKLNDAQYMNEWLRAKLLQQHSGDDYDEKDQPQPAISSSSQYYLQDNGHFTSQYDFVFGPHQVRMLDYVLRMEDLNESFPRLVAAYFDLQPPGQQQQIRLEHHNAIGAAQRSTNQTTTAALEAETVRAIRQLYRRDFILGRYDDEEEDETTAAKETS